MNTQMKQQSVTLKLTLIYNNEIDLILNNSEERREKKDYNYVYKYFIYYCTRKILFEIHLKWSKKSFYDYCDYR